MRRAQSAAEYVTLLALVFVLVASLMLVSFRQQEVTLAIASARLGCIEFSELNSSNSCYEIRYFYVGSGNVTISPITNIASPVQKAELQAQIVSNLASVFNPAKQVSGKCYSAPNYSYCVEFP
ncbi:MAG: hypothetical protein ABH863_06440 [Candidatus Micrarchaeota archaeon]